MVLSVPVQDANESLTGEIIDLGQKVDLNVNKENIEEFSAPLGSALTIEELLEAEQSPENETMEVVEDDLQDEAVDEIDTEKAAEAVQLVNRAMELFRDSDPDVTRRVSVHVALQAAIMPYQLLVEKKN